MKLIELVMSTLYKNPSNKPRTTTGRGGLLFVLFLLLGIGVGFGQAPSGYSVTIDQDPINGANETGVGFTFAGAEPAAGYDYTFSSDGGGADVTGSGTITTATDQVTGIDLSGLGDGTITLSVTLTNGSGAGDPATDTSIKDTAVPSGYS
ncbi:MAG: hypothetical protein ACX93O_07620, partial [Flagellimonas sp.]